MLFTVETRQNSIMIQQQQRSRIQMTMVPSVAMGYESPYSDSEVINVEIQTAKELNALSCDNRERLLEEMNGIADMIEEDPTFIAERLRDLDLEIDQIQDGRSAYELAMSMRPEIRNDTAFRLMVLRACRFEAHKAARMMMNHFEFKLKMFGQDKLVKSIKYEDLNEEDREAFMTGTCQVLPEKDQAGRKILSISSKLNTFGTWHNHFRSIWFQLLKLAEADESVQQKGVLFVFNNIGLSKGCVKFDDIVRNMKMLSEALPFRVGGIHFCYDSPKMRPAALYLQYALGSSLRLRFRAHYGTQAECQSRLMTFGIPQATLNDVVADINCLATTQMKEKSNVISRASSSSSLADFMEQNGIVSNDVLIGSKGGQHERHPGNMYLCKIIDESWDIYQATNHRFEKTCIIIDIVRKVREADGRFVKCQSVSGSKDVQFIEVGDKEARCVVGQRFRNKKKLSTASKRRRLKQKNLWYF